MIKSICPVILAFMTATAFAQSPTTPAGSASGRALTDQQIAKVLLTINEGEIAAAKLATQHATNPEVKDFAKMMQTEHEKNLKDTTALTTKTKINAADNDMAKYLKTDADKSNTELSKSDKKAFDKSYLKQQLAMHEKALSTLNESLIPNSQNAELRAHLEKTRDAVAGHLAHAKTLDTKIK